MRRIGFDCVDPGADLVGCGCDENSAKASGADLEAAESATEEGARSGGVAGVQMVEGCGHLDESLEEALLGLLQRKPGAFPMLVSFEEFFALVAGEAFGERGGGPVERHGDIIGPVELAIRDLHGEGFGFLNRQAKPASKQASWLPTGIHSISRGLLSMLYHKFCGWIRDFPGCAGFKLSAYPSQNAE